MMTLTVAGNVGKDAVLRRTHDDQPVLNFSVAVTKVERGERSTQWVDCSLWGRRGEALAEFVTKGSKVTVVGEAGLVEHNGKTYMKVRAYDIELQGGGKRESDGAPPSPRTPAPRNGRQAQPPADNFDDDDIPF